MDLWIRLPVNAKSLDVSKAVDKAAGAERQVTGRTVTPFKVDAAASRGTSLQGSANGDFSKQVDERGYRYTEHTAPTTDAAREWSGWGTSLKPAHEPIIVARRPFPGNVAANVLEHGTGALNIDASRVPGPAWTFTHSDKTGRSNGILGASAAREGVAESHAGVRWPANVVFTHSPNCTETACDTSCPVAELDRQSAGTRSEKGAASGPPGKGRTVYRPRDYTPANDYGDSGSASRFFHAFRWEEKAPTNQRPSVWIPAKALRLRSDLTDQQQAYVVAELQKAGIDVA